MAARDGNRPVRPAIRLSARSLATVAALLLAAASLLTACSSGSPPPALPPQTMTPAPPSVSEPVSSMPQELEPEQLPTTDGEPQPPAAGTGAAPATADGGEATEGSTATVVIEAGNPEEENQASSSLYDAARAEKERRASAGESAIVLNDKNLKEYSKGKLTYVEGGVEEPATGESGDAASEAAGAAVDTAAAEAEATADETTPGQEIWRQEQFWRNRVLDIRMAWREALDRIDELEADIARLRRDFYAEDDPFYRDSQIKPAWDRALEDLEETRREAELRQQELDDVLDEGHREGALPGWLREGIELEPTDEELSERRLEGEPGEFHEPSEPVVAEDDGGGEW